MEARGNIKMNYIDIHSSIPCNLHPEQRSRFKGKTEPIIRDKAHFISPLRSGPNKNKIFKYLDLHKKINKNKELIKNDYTKLHELRELRVVTHNSSFNKKAIVSPMLEIERDKKATTDFATRRIFSRQLFKHGSVKRSKTILDYRIIHNIREFEYKLDEFKENLKTVFEEKDLIEIDKIRSFAIEKGSTYPKPLYLLEKANNLLFAHYQNNLSDQIKKLERGANNDTIMELSRLRYIISRLDEKKNIKQLEYESFKYANEIISAGNKLAVILGVSPLE